MELQCTAAADGNGALLASLKRKLHHVLRCNTCHACTTGAVSLLVHPDKQAEKHCLQRQLEGAWEQADGSQAELAAAHAAAADFESKFLAERQQRRQVRYRRSTGVSVLGDEAASTTTPGVFMNLPTE